MLPLVLFFLTSGNAVKYFLFIVQSSYSYIDKTSYICNIVFKEYFTSKKVYLQLIIKTF